VVAQAIVETAHQVTPLVGDDIDIGGDHALERGTVGGGRTHDADRAVAFECGRRQVDRVQQHVQL
jgi:hypothetical protein